MEVENKPHDMAAPKGRPEWWIENEKLREFLGLPSYTPPRFSDGAYTHDVVPDLEERHGCEIQFIGVNVEYLEDWEVRIDGEPEFTIGHGRDENGNTIYGIDSEQFTELVNDHA